MSGRPFCTFCGGDFGKHTAECPKSVPIDRRHDTGATGQAGPGTRRADYLIRVVTVSTLSEVVENWEVQAESQRIEQPQRAATLRECADLLRMTCAGISHDVLPSNLNPGARP